MRYFLVPITDFFRLDQNNRLINFVEILYSDIYFFGICALKKVPNNETHVKKVLEDYLNDFLYVKKFLPKFIPLQLNNSQGNILKVNEATTNKEFLIPEENLEQFEVDNTKFKEYLEQLLSSSKQLLSLKNNIDIFASVLYKDNDTVIYDKTITYDFPIPENNSQNDSEDNKTFNTTIYDFETERKRP